MQCRLPVGKAGYEDAGDATRDERLSTKDFMGWTLIWNHLERRARALKESKESQKVFVDVLILPVVYRHPVLIHICPAHKGLELQMLI